MEEISINKIELLAHKGIDLILDYGPRFLLAVLTLFVGLRLIKLILKIIKKAFEKGKLDLTLRPFLLGVTGWTLRILLFISVASMLGVETTSFVAVLGAAGLAVGLALQGTLGNFAGGVLCLVFKPYEVGDLIEAQGAMGEVQEIQIFTTILLTLDNETIIVPNGAIMNGNIINYTRKGNRRVDLTIGISYKADLKLAKEALRQTMIDHPKVLKNPAPLIGVQEYGDSSINLAVMPYCLPQDYWEVYFDVMEAMKFALDKHNIEIPFPQRDVHIYQEKESL